MGKHVIDGHQDLWATATAARFVSTSGFETVKFVPQVSALGFAAALAASTKAVFR